MYTDHTSETNPEELNGIQDGIKTRAAAPCVDTER